MLTRIRTVLVILLALVVLKIVGSAFAAMNQPDDVSVAFGVVMLLGLFVLFPWCVGKLVRKGKPDA